MFPVLHAVPGCYHRDGGYSGKDIMQVDVRIAWNVASTIVYMNAAINLGLYFYRMRDVREAVKDTLKIIFCQ